MFTEIFEHAHQGGQSPLQFFEQFVMHLPIGVTVIDAQGKQLYVNEEARRIFRWEFETMSSARDWHHDYGCFDPNDVSQQIPLEDLPGVQALLGEPASAHMILRTPGMRKTGEFESGVYVLARCSPWKAQDGKMLGVISVLHETPPPCSSCPARSAGPPLLPPVVSLPRINPRFVPPDGVGVEAKAGLPAEEELASLRETVRLLRGQRSSDNIDAIEAGLVEVHRYLSRAAPKPEDREASEPTLSKHG